MRAPLVGFVCLLTVVAAACGREDCPAHTRQVDGRCVAGGGGEDPQDAGSDATGCDGRTFHRDADDDGWGTDETTSACEAEPGWVERGGDCDDESSAVHPGATETCNGVDDDCANGADDTFDCVQGSSGVCDTACGTTGTWTCTAACGLGTCVPPAEVCNYVDDDCDGWVDPGLQAVQGAAVRMNDASSMSIGEPRIEWGGAQLAVGWTSMASIVVTMRTTALAEIEPPQALVTDNANASAWDLAYSDTLFVSNHDTGGAAGAERYAVTEHGDDLADVTGWYAPVGGALSVVRVESVPAPTGAVGFFETSASDIRARGVASGAGALHTGVTLSGTDPDGARTPTGSVVVAYREAGEMAVAVVDDDGDESIGHRAVTAIGGLVSRVAIAQARADATVGIFETNSGAAPLRSVLLDDGLNAGDPVDISDEGRIEPDGIAASASEFLVTFWLVSGGVAHHWVQRLDLAGVPNGAPVEIPRIWTSAGSFVDPRAAWTGEGWGIAYVDDADDNGSSGWDVYAVRFGCP